MSLTQRDMHRNCRNGPAAGARPLYVIDFDAACVDDYPRLGGKGANLAALIAANAPVPPGFAVTIDAYAAMLDADGLRGEIARSLASHDHDDIASQARIARDIQQAIARRRLPIGVSDAIRSSYQALCTRHGRELPVAIRSSGSAEDMPNASFAGQGDTYLWTIGERAVLDRVKSCWASLFNARALAYRAKHAQEQIDVSMAVAVQQMVDAEASGVAMTLDPSNGDRSKIVVEAAWGLGEPVVSGEITPDHFVIDKIMLEPINRKIAVKSYELVADRVARKTSRRDVEPERQSRPSVTDVQLKNIAKMAKTMERHFGCPQDIEWAIDRHRVADDAVVLLQSRPETCWSAKQAATTPNKIYATGVEGVLSTLLKPVVLKKT